VQSHTKVVPNTAAGRCRTWGVSQFAPMQRRLAHTGDGHAELANRQLAKPSSVIVEAVVHAPSCDTLPVAGGRSCPRTPGPSPTPGEGLLLSGHRRNLGCRQAAASGATMTDHAHDLPWGIYSGYFRDLDGHLWEILWNPELEGS